MISPFRTATALLCAIALSSASLGAQTVIYTDAASFPLYGKAVEAGTDQYERLPAALESELKDSGRGSVWELGRDAAGLFLRFRSDSPLITARWTSTYTARMNHMTDTGVRGLDLYTLADGQWRFVGSGRPGSSTTTEARLLENGDGMMREYMLYLPLYDGVRKLEIGTLDGTRIEGPATERPRKGGQIVMYGTSILQGGCASRPGMAFTAIIGRRLDREVINLGFSGNGRLDYPIARLMAAVEDPAVFVLDEVPNCEGARIDSNGETFFRILRDAHPDVPVVFIENPLYPPMKYNKHFGDDVPSRNAAQRRLFDKLKKAGEKRIYYIPADKLIGTDDEATVDGVHFTDLGMMRYSDAVTPLLKRLAK